MLILDTTSPLPGHIIVSRLHVPLVRPHRDGKRAFYLVTAVAAVNRSIIDTRHNASRRVHSRDLHMLCDSALPA
jgi:hypothetical protein